MTIKDVEERTGLSRSNIRFYEKEKLIEPSRNESITLAIKQHNLCYEFVVVSDIMDVWKK